MHEPLMGSPQVRALSEQLNVIACVLREARQEAGLSQRSLAQRLGKANSHVSKIESGLRRVDALELYRIADAFGLPPSTLFERVASRLSEPASGPISSD
ncbi:MAG: helix-turn-helix domain-containing protein [Caulobacter sp.]